jgi:predicted acyl esterase
VKLYDVDPHGNKIQLTTGWLKASHRELDEDKSKPWRPYHPHTRSVPVVPGEVCEYAIRIYSFSNVFKTGHRMELELSSQESFTDATMALLPPDSFHLPSGRATTHKIYRDRNHPSHLFLPIIPHG